MENSKILFIGNVLENTGYSLADRYFIRDLSRFSTVKIFHTPITFRRLNNPSEWMNLLTKDVNNYNGYIVCCPITLLFPHKKFSFFWLHDYLEFPISTVQKINDVKNAFLPSKKQKEALSLLSSTPVYNYCPVIYKPGINTKVKDYGNKLVFYTISESVTQETLMKSIFCYYWAFTSSDNVLLHISLPPKTKDVFIQELKNNIQKSCFNIRTNLPEIAIDDTDYTDEQRWMLHKTCNVYISINNSDGLPISTLEAAKTGNFVIYNENIPLYDELLKPWSPQGCVKSTMEPGYNMNDHIDNNYSSSSIRYSPCLFEVIDLMKNLYTQGYNITPLEQEDNTKEIVDAINS